MAVSYELTGRRNQKARTRTALIDATRELLARGVVPTMESAAAAAAVSRTTAYRYFANLPALLTAAYPHIEQLSLLGADPPQDPEARLAIVVEEHTRRILDNEPEMRAVLRLSLQGIRPLELPMHRWRSHLHWHLAWPKPRLWACKRHAHPGSSETPRIRHRACSSALNLGGSSPNTAPESSG
jgi:AcrR family transcriptional regulator